jgi:vacuolar protein sorting-associated protein 26
MDGSPSRGETIPIRLFLGGFDLTPTFRDVNKKFSTRYYLSLVLIDEGKSNMIFLDILPYHQANLRVSDARRYFKQSEIILYRQAPEAGPSQPQLSMVPAPDQNRMREMAV